MVCFPINIEYLTTFYVGMAIARFPMLSICIYIRLLCVLTGWYYIYWSCRATFSEENPVIFCAVFTIVLRVFSVRLFKRMHMYESWFSHSNRQCCTMLLFVKWTMNRLKRISRNQRRKIQICIILLVPSEAIDRQWQWMLGY